MDEIKHAIAFILLAFVVVCSSEPQGILGPDWTRGLTESLNQLNANIQGTVKQLNEQIQGNVQQINRQVENDVRGHLAMIDRLKSDLPERIAKTGDYRTITLNNGGTTILVNGVNSGSSRIVYNGIGPNGKPYFRDIEEWVVGNILHHNEKFYNPETQKMEENRYTLDLSKPDAKPIPVSN